VHVLCMHIIGQRDQIGITSEATSLELTSRTSVHLRPPGLKSLLYQNITIYF
jgi:hypothetical protein